MAVEELTQGRRAGLDGIVVARVLETRGPPRPTRSTRSSSTPATDEPLEIGCGAFNMQAGDLVPLATIGTVDAERHGDRPPQDAGVWSNGMLCSAAELGLGDDHDGILILPPGTELGTPVTEAMGIGRRALRPRDQPEPTRRHVGRLGVARDLAARLGVPFPPPTPELVADGPERSGVRSRSSRPIAAVASTSACSAACASVRPPPWMAERLARAGMRSINNVVDVSNYVMLELGEPNHPYDLAKVAGGGFRVRRAATARRS